jgi:restriction system protein
VFSTSGFQSGALEFAQTHGIATVQLADGRSSYFTKAYGQEFEPPPWLPRFAAWLLAEHSATLVSSENPRPLLEALGAARVEGD